MALLQFENPWLLLLAPLCVAAALALTLRRSARRRHARIGVALRVTIALCAVASLAGPKIRWPGRQVCRVYLLDTSASVSAAKVHALESVRQSLKTLKPGDTAALILFGARPAVELAPEKVSELAVPVEIKSSVDPGGTDLPAALQLARSVFPQEGARQLVLLWDGNNTGGGLLAPAAELAGDGTDVAVVPLDVGSVVDARIDRVRAPRRLREGQSAGVEVIVAATVATTVQAALDCDGLPRAEPQSVLVQAGRAARVLFTVELDEGWHKVEARIVEPKDAWPQNDLAATFVHVGGRTPVAVLSRRSDPWLAGLLGANPNLAVSVLPAGESLDLATALNKADCLIIDDMPQRDLANAQQQAMTQYVEGGGGLVVTGGRNSFGPGGYIGAELERILPVRCDPKREKSKPVAVAIVLDKSGSMGESVAGRPKIDYARLGVMRVVEQLKPADSMTLIVFDASASVIIPLGPVNDPERVKQIVGKIYARGQTNINPALDEAYRALKDRPRGTSHILLLSDGLSTEAVEATAVAGRMKQAGITLSAVATGADADRDMLRQLALDSGGRFYLAEDIRRLPEIFSSDIRTLTQELIIEGPQEAAIVRAGGMLEGLDKLPRMGGYVLTAPRDEATVHAVIGDERDALLAGWNAGLGRCVAFTSTAGGDWDASWESWPGREAFWNQVVRWAARPADSGLLAIELEQDADSIRVTVLADAEAVTAIDSLRADAILPSGEKIVLSLRRTGVRKLEGGIAAAADGVYGVNVTSREMPGLRASERLHVGYSAEWRALGLNETAVEEFARAAGGRVVTDLAGWSRTQASGWQYAGIGWLLLLAGTALFLLDLAVT